MRLSTAVQLLLLATTPLAAQAPRWDPAAGDCDRGAPEAPPGLLQNMVTMETFAIRDGLIHHVEVFPFVSLPFGLGDGWTPGSGH